MGVPRRNRLLMEQPVPQDGRERDGKGSGIRKPKAESRSVTVNMAESPLGWLRSRGLVSERQFDAGERLRADWERAQMERSTTMRWDAPPTGRTARGAPDALDPTSAQIAAKQRLEAAVEAVGAGLSDVLWRIVCAGVGLREAERALGWPARAGRLVLGLALDRLADFYRIK